MANSGGLGYVLREARAATLWPGWSSDAVALGEAVRERVQHVVALPADFPLDARHLRPGLHPVLGSLLLSGELSLRSSEPLVDVGGVSAPENR